jgi:hypothetical protein
MDVAFLHISAWSLRAQTVLATARAVALGKRLRKAKPESSLVHPRILMRKHFFHGKRYDCSKQKRLDFLMEYEQNGDYFVIHNEGCFV